MLCIIYTNWDRVASKANAKHILYMWRAFRAENGNGPRFFFVLLAFQVLAAQSMIYCRLNMPLKSRRHNKCSLLHGWARPLNATVHDFAHLKLHSPSLIKALHTTSRVHDIACLFWNGIKELSNFIGTVPSNFTFKDRVDGDWNISKFFQSTCKLHQPLKLSCVIGIQNSFYALPKRIPSCWPQFKSQSQQSRACCEGLAAV